MEPRPHSVLRICDNKALELIDLYEKEQCLWNTNLDGYKCRAKRHKAAERIASKLGIKHFTSRYVIIKFKNLRNSYCQELRKMASSEAAGEDPPYRPKVFWFKKMDSFLRPHLHQIKDPNLRLNHEVIIKSEPTDADEFVQPTNPEDAITDENLDYSDSDDDDVVGLPTKRSRNSSTTSKKPKNEGQPKPPSTEMVSLMKEISSHLQMITSNKADVYDSFGKYISAVLRGMPLQRAMETQSQIVNLLATKALCKEETVVTDSNISKGRGLNA